MKVLHFSTYDDLGGASKAARRIHDRLVAFGIFSKFFVQYRTRNFQAIEVLGSSKVAPFLHRLRLRIDNFPLFLFKKKNLAWSIGWYPKHISKKVLEYKPDIVHLHWINSGYISLSDIGDIKCNVVWTLHDSWAFTGGCHIVGSCDSFMKKCGHCPQLADGFLYDLSYIGHYRKSRLYKNKNITFVAPSSWMAKMAKSSSLLSEHQIEVIPNGLDTDSFRPLDKSLSRKQLGLPQNKKILMFGAISSTSNPNKGFQILKESLLELSKMISPEDVHVAIFGASKSDSDGDLVFPTTYLGIYMDELSMASVYSAADVICVPSFQESFCQVASEAMSCGIPVVAFATSGLLDVVKHNVTGILAECFDPVSFATSIFRLLDDDDLRAKMSVAARKRAVRLFDISVVSRKYDALYQKIISESNLR